MMSLSRKFRETAVVRTKICPGPGFGSLILTRRRLSRPVFSSSQLFICSPCFVFDFGSSLLCIGLADCPLQLIDHRSVLQVDACIPQMDTSNYLQNVRP